MRQLILIFSIVTVFLLSSFTDFKNVLFQNEKVIFYVKDGGLRMNILLENFEEGESYNFRYYIYSKPKKLVGSEEVTSNKDLIDQYISKYKYKAFKDYFKVSFAEFEKEQHAFKIVTEAKNDKMYFYYYHSEVNGGVKSCKSSNKKIDDSSWSYIGANNFLFDVYSNDKLLMSKHFNLQN